MNSLFSSMLKWGCVIILLICIALFLKSIKQEKEEVQEIRENQPILREAPPKPRPAPPITFRDTSKDDNQGSIDGIQ